MYTEAVVTEAIRFTAIVPTGVPQRALKDTQLQGHFIPKVLANYNIVETDANLKIWRTFFKIIGQFYNIKPSLNFA